MVDFLPAFAYFTLFLINRDFISKIRRSKVTDYAALIENGSLMKVKNILQCFLPALSKNQS